MHINVAANFFLTAIWGTAGSMWNGTILVSYIFTLSNGELSRATLIVNQPNYLPSHLIDSLNHEGSNTKVGLVEAGSGFTALLATLCLSWAAEKVPLFPHQMINPKPLPRWIAPYF